VRGQKWLVVLVYLSSVRSKYRYVYQAFVQMVQKRCASHSNLHLRLRQAFERSVFAGVHLFAARSTMSAGVQRVVACIDKNAS
jgi:hypothetical protein